MKREINWTTAFFTTYMLVAVLTYGRFYAKNGLVLAGGEQG